MGLLSGIGFVFLVQLRFFDNLSKIQRQRRQHEDRGNDVMLPLRGHSEICNIGDLFLIFSSISHDVIFSETYGNETATKLNTNILNLSV